MFLQKKYPSYRNSSGRPSKSHALIGFLALSLCTSIAGAADKTGSPLSPEYDPNNTSMGDEQAPVSASLPAPSFKDGVIQGDLDAIRQAISEAESVGTLQSGLGTVRAIVTLRPASPGEAVSTSLSRVPLIEAAVEGTGSRLVLEWKHIPAIVMDLDTSGLDALIQLDTVGGLELDVEHKADLTSSRAVTGADIVNAEGHEGGGYGGRTPWEVAIIDTGVRSTHDAITGNSCLRGVLYNERQLPQRFKLHDRGRRWHTLHLFWLLPRHPCRWHCSR